MPAGSTAATVRVCEPLRSLHLCALLRIVFKVDLLSTHVADVSGGTLKKQLGEPTMMPDWSKDAAAGKLILERAGLEVFHSPLHLEGGSIHTDGEGCVSRHRPAYSDQSACEPSQQFAVRHAQSDTQLT